MIDFSNLSKEAQEKLMYLGVKYLIERAHLADFPIPSPTPVQKKKKKVQKRKKLHWTQRPENKAKLQKQLKLMRKAKQNAKA